MKKILIVLIIVMAAVLVFAACSTQEAEQKIIDAMTEDTMEDESMDTEDTMDKDDSMDKDDDNMGGHDEEEDKEPGTVAEFLNTTMVDINGNEWNLSELGDKAVVKVWASWCSICLSGMDEYNEFAATNEDGLVLTVVAPGFNGEKNKEDFIEWFNGLENTENIVVILDEENVLFTEFGLRGFPTYIYLHSDGTVFTGAIGHQSREAVVGALDSLY